MRSRDALRTSAAPTSGPGRAAGLRPLVAALALAMLAHAGAALAQTGIYEDFDDLVAVPPFTEVDPLAGVCPAPPCATWSVVGPLGDAAYRIQADASSVGSNVFGPSRAISYLASQSLADFYVTADYLDWSGAAGPADSVHAVGAGRQIGFGTTDGYVLAHEVPTGAGTERVSLARIDDEAYTVLTFQNMTLDPAKDYRLTLWRSGDDLTGLVRELPGGGTVATLSATDASGWTDLSPGLLVAGTNYNDQPDATFDAFYGGGDLAREVQAVTEYIAVGPGDQFDAAIGDGYVSYTTNIGGSNDVFLLHPNGLPVVVDGGAGTQEDSDVEGPLVVYTNDATGPADVYLFDNATGVSFPIFQSPTTEIDPAIDVEGVVFVSSTAGSDLLIYYDFASQLPANLDSVAIEPRDPSIDWPLVAWSAFDGSATNIYATVLGGSSFVVEAGPANETKPTVSGNRIAFLSDGDVRVYDRATGQTTAVTNDSFSQLHAVITGNLVYFNDDRFGNFEIFVHDLSSGETYRLTSTPWDEFLTDADGNQAVFHHNGFGVDFDVFRLTTSLPTPVIPAVEPWGLALLAASILLIGVFLGYRRSSATR